MNDVTRSVESTYRGMRVHVLEQDNTISVRITCVGGEGGGLISVPSSLRCKLADILELAAAELARWNQ